MVVCFDRSFASSVVNSTLAMNTFEVPFVKRKNSLVSFVAGQPLGYYGSWPLFALSHHIKIWLCADPGERFLSYAVLGDDVVIAHKEIAYEYESALKRLGVTISYQKSLISEKGSAEFAKRFRVRGLTRYLSPVSIRNLLKSFHPFGLMAVQMTYPQKRFSPQGRIGGAGLKTLAKLDHRRPLRACAFYVLQTTVAFRPMVRSR